MSALQGATALPALEGSASSPKGPQCPVPHLMPYRQLSTYKVTAGSQCPGLQGAPHNSTLEWSSPSGSPHLAQAALDPSQPTTFYCSQKTCTLKSPPETDSLALASLTCLPSPIHLCWPPSLVHALAGASARSFCRTFAPSDSATYMPLSAPPLAPPKVNPPLAPHYRSATSQTQLFIPNSRSSPSFAQVGEGLSCRAVPSSSTTSLFLTAQALTLTLTLAAFIHPINS